MLASSSLPFTAGFLYLLIGVALVTANPLPSGPPPYKSYGYDPDQYLRDPYAGQKDPTSHSVQGSSTNAGHQGYSGYRGLSDFQGYPGHQGKFNHPSTELTQGSSTDIGYQNYLFQNPSSTNQLPAPSPSFSHTEHYYPDVGHKIGHLAAVLPGYGQREWNNQRRSSHSLSSPPPEGGLTRYSGQRHVGFHNEELADDFHNLNMEGSDSVDEKVYGGEEHAEGEEQEEEGSSASASSRKKKKKKNNQRKRRGKKISTEYSPETHSEPGSDFDFYMPFEKWYEDPHLESFRTFPIREQNAEDHKKKLLAEVINFVELQDKALDAIKACSSDKSLLAGFQNVALKKKADFTVVNILHSIRDVKKRNEVKRDIVTTMCDIVLHKVGHRELAKLTLGDVLRETITKLDLLPFRVNRSTIPILEGMPEADPAVLDPFQDDKQEIEAYVKRYMKAVNIKRKQESNGEDKADELYFPIVLILHNFKNREERVQVKNDLIHRMYKDKLQYKALGQETDLVSLIKKAMHDMGYVWDSKPGEGPESTSGNLSIH